MGRQPNYKKMCKVIIYFACVYIFVFVLNAKYSVASNTQNHSAWEHGNIQTCNKARGQEGLSAVISKRKGSHVQKKSWSNVLRI